MTDEWSAVAPSWARWWGGFAAPVRAQIVRSAGLRAGMRVLDVGCGSGEFLAELTAGGMLTAGTDPSPAMVELAHRAEPAADVRLGYAEALPWPDDQFELVAAVNALQFADDLPTAVAELARVAAPGGRIALANWAEHASNELDAIDAALGDGPAEDSELRLPGGLERLLSGAGLELADAGVVEVPWEAPDDAGLTAGILFGEDDPGQAALIVDAARPFRLATGGYRFLNHFRYAVAVV
jgi:SAM-dependent methyltransferase